MWRSWGRTAAVSSLPFLFHSAGEKKKFALAEEDQDDLEREKVKKRECGRGMKGTEGATKLENMKVREKRKSDRGERERKREN